MNHYAILTSSSKFYEVIRYISENKLKYEPHLNRTRFWVPEEKLQEFISLYGGYCDYVPSNQDLQLGTPID